MRNMSLLGARGGLGGIISLFIKFVIYDLCITGIMNIFGVSHTVALFIFLGILAVISFGGYMIRQRVAHGVDD